MSAGDRHPSEQTRTEARRLQILEAAAGCFRRSGFHGASIAEISKAAGMSPGHIYHYFENKEAIIAAIVEQGLSEALAVLDGLRSSDDTFRALLAKIDWAVERTVASRDSALKLEIVAEAARNPRVAGTVRGVDQTMRRELRDTLRAGRRPRNWTDRELEGRVEFILALFEGLLVRAVRHPDLDKAAVADVFRIAVRAALDA